MPDVNVTKKRPRKRLRVRGLSCDHVSCTPVSMPMWDAPHCYGAGGRHLSAGPAQRTTPVGLGSWARVAGSLELIDQCESDGAGTRRPVAAIG